MSTIVYRISVVLGAILANVPVGTNLGLFWLLWALISGRFLLGSDIHAMLALYSCFGQIVVANEILDGADMIGEGLGKRQCTAYQT